MRKESTCPRWKWSTFFCLLELQGHQLQRREGALEVSTPWSNAADFGRRWVGSWRGSLVRSQSSRGSLLVSSPNSEMNTFEEVLEPGRVPVTTRTSYQ